MIRKKSEKIVQADRFRRFLRFVWNWIHPGMNTRKLRIRRHGMASDGHSYRTVSEGCPFLYSTGVMPVCFLKTLLKDDLELNPDS